MIIVFFIFCSNCGFLCNNYYFLLGVFLDVGCQNLAVCGAGYFISVLPTYTSDRYCQFISDCYVAGYNYVAGNFSVTKDRNCTLLTVCAPGLFISTNSTPTSDQSCSACTLGSNFSMYFNSITCTPVKTCSFLNGYYQIAATSTSDAICVPVSICSLAQYESLPATATSDRQCVTRKQCGVGFYASEIPLTSDTTCSVISNCTPGLYISANFTQTTDRSCAFCSAGTSYSILQNSYICAVISICNTSQYESFPPTLQMDRQCVTRKQCGVGFYASEIPLTSDTTCSVISNCTPGLYISANFTQTTDRSCTYCSAGTSYSILQNSYQV